MINAAFAVANRLASMHKGRVNTYAAYILLAMVLALIMVGGTGR
jgi:hydrogenase-4 component B